MAPRSNRDELHGLEGSTPSLSASQHVPLADRQRHQPSKLARRVRFPQGALHIPGSSLLVVMPGFEPGVRRFDSYPRNSDNDAG